MTSVAGNRPCEGGRDLPVTLSRSTSPDILCKVSQDSVIDSGIRAKGHRHIRSVPSAATVKNETIIQKSWNELDQGQLTPKEFVDRVKYRVGGCSSVASIHFISFHGSFISELLISMIQLELS